jgi:hypothetical protein
VLGDATFADPLGNPQIGLSDIPEQFGKVDADVSLLLEQKFLKHGLMDRDHLPEMSSEKVHEKFSVEFSEWVPPCPARGAAGQAASNSDGASQ